MLKRISYNERGTMKNGLMTESGLIYDAATGIMIDPDTIQVLDILQWTNMASVMEEDLPSRIEVQPFPFTDEYVLWSNENEEYVKDKEGNVLSFKTEKMAMEYIEKEEAGNG